MPIYEYKCRRCGRVCEFLQKIGDPFPKHCPSCGGPLEKVISSPAIQFKGTGWYITDYARKNSPPEKTQKPSGDQKKEPPQPKKKEASTGKPQASETG